MPSTAQWIRFFDRVKLTDSAPELFFDEVAASAGYNPAKPKPIDLTDDEGNAWTFRPDRVVRDAYIEILGPYHFTPRQESKTRWRSELVVRKTGKRLLLVDSPLLVPDHAGYVARELKAFLGSKEPWKRLYA